MQILKLGSVISIRICNTGHLITVLFVKYGNLVFFFFTTGNYLLLSGYIERFFPELLPLVKAKMNPGGDRTSADLVEVVKSYNQTVPPKRLLRLENLFLIFRVSADYFCVNCSSDSGSGSIWDPYSMAF